MLRFTPLLLVLVSAPLSARDSLGVFNDWAAFRDPSVPRCYAIAKPEPNRRARDHQGFATIGTWPGRQIRGQVHFRLSRMLASRPSLQLRIGTQRFDLIGGGADAWAQNRTMDAAIVAAMRSATRMSIRGTDSRGRRFSDAYLLAGAATAMDAATLACARR